MKPTIFSVAAYAAEIVTTIRRRWRMSRLYDRYEAACWSFFGYHPIGRKILDIVDKLHEKYPESDMVFKLWLFCLPF